MSELVSFRMFLNEVLTAAAFEIFGAVENMLVECMKENIPRSYMKQQELDSLQFPISEEEVPPEQQDWTPSLGQFSVSEGEDPLHKAQLTEYPALSPLNASKLQMFSGLLNNLLTTSAAQEISGSVEKMLVKYREENDRLGRMLRLTPEIKLCRIDSLQFSLSVSEEDVSPELQDCSPTLRKENPETTQIKEEQEEHRISKGEEHDQGVEPNIIEFIFPPSVKRECDPVTNLKNLNQLKPFHTGDKSFGCGDCEKSFSQKGILTKYKPTHTEEKSHSSGDCGKSFCNKGTVKQYKLTHKREKPFSCDDCGKSFSLKWTLTQHKMTHTGEKPFICADCGKQFRQRGTLTKHKLTHTGEKPFCCGDCGKSFMYRHHLKQHEQTHTGEKPFCCGDCGKSFMYKHHLKKHKLTHTGEK
ncbi:zinc finger protein 501-like isoform X6 [Esox lucius]|uniref:zinc finger protein 501-like isoform X6 n=1 Tax=Esox lucius TaxID=8010 RepID=UPI0014771794|nr:zinc finger protein 501-like isoform X6 [Esox lucius]